MYPTKAYLIINKYLKGTYCLSITPKYLKHSIFIVNIKQIFMKWRQTSKQKCTPNQNNLFLNVNNNPHQRDTYEW